MKIELLYIAGCPGYQGAEAIIDEVVRSLGLRAEIERVEVRMREQAIRLRFLGSPTIRVNGVDIDPAGRSRTDYGLKCRVYRIGNHFVPVPRCQLLERAIKEARNGQDCCAPHRQEVPVGSGRRASHMRGLREGLSINHFMLTDGTIAPVLSGPCVIEDLWTIPASRSERKHI